MGFVAFHVAAVHAPAAGPRTWPTPPTRRGCSCIVLPLLLAIVLSELADGTLDARPWPCSASSRRAARRCGCPAGASPGSRPSSSCCSPPVASSGGASASCSARSRCSPPRSSPAGWARGCRTRCSAWPGWASSPAACRGHRAGPRSPCSAPTASSPASRTGCCSTSGSGPSRGVRRQRHGLRRRGASGREPASLPGVRHRHIAGLRPASRGHEPGAGGGHGTTGAAGAAPGGPPGVVRHQAQLRERRRCGRGPARARAMRRSAAPERSGCRGTVASRDDA